MKITKSQLKRIIKEEIENILMDDDANYDPFRVLLDVDITANEELNEDMGVLTIPLIAAVVLAGGAGFLSYIGRKAIKAEQEFNDFVETSKADMLLLTEMLVTDPVLIMQAKRLAELTILVDLNKGKRSKELQSLREEHKDLTGSLNRGISSGIEKYAGSDERTKVSLKYGMRQARKDSVDIDRAVKRVLKASGEERLDLNSVKDEADRLGKEATGKRTGGAGHARKKFLSRTRSQRKSTRSQEMPEPAAGDQNTDNLDRARRARASKIKR